MALWGSPSRRALQTPLGAGETSGAAPRPLSTSKGPKRAARWSDVEDVALGRERVDDA
eukprot:CAMPEP_0184121940 /NCGR_PEP_ID=MMETSP0974-20121125/23231_1 /TAXON_ID=483370 /ORGANISM="non described non described, Strain CCMP2097" /LENGTH=57 /DNA_ID=CAMNT_0026425163 /DNA_START=73 /DNA_END=242 /DNA_ORIENTATION=+